VSGAVVSTFWSYDSQNVDRDRREAVKSTFWGFRANFGWDNVTSERPADIRVTFAGDSPVNVTRAAGAPANVTLSVRARSRGSAATS
jgi:hypothetical protein